MKALTVQQPWAWAIIHGSKDVENRTQLWSYRGPLAIHAGQRTSQRGFEFAPLVAGLEERRDRDEAGRLPRGAIIGVVDLVGVHEAQPEIHATGSTYSAACCDSPWGEQANHHAQRLVHLELANPRPLRRPIPCRGRLGLWNLPPELLRDVVEGQVLTA